MSKWVEAFVRWEFPSDVESEEAKSHLAVCTASMEMAGSMLSAETII